MENQFTATSTAALRVVEYVLTTIVGMVSTGEQIVKTLNNFFFQNSTTTQAENGKETPQ